MEASNVRTEENFLIQHKSEQSIAARAKTVQNPEWQATKGLLGRQNRGKATSTPALRAAASQTGKLTQKRNSKNRVDPLTWFLTCCVLIFSHESNKIYNNIPDETNYIENNASDIGRKLSQEVINSSLSNSPFVISSIIRGEKKTRYGWSLIAVKINNIEYKPEKVRNWFTIIKNNKFIAKSDLNAFLKLCPESDKNFFEKAQLFMQFFLAEFGSD